MISRHFVPAFAIGALVFIAGCETSEIARVGEEPRAEIGYAATASYPGEPMAATKDFQVAALDNPDAHELELLNLTDNSIPASSVWVNGAFVKRIASIPPRGTLKVKYSELLEAGRSVNDLQSVGQIARKVEIQTPQGLMAVQGPSNRTK